MNVQTSPAKTIKQPGPDHPITIRPSGKHITVSVGGRIIADTKNALTLQESTYPAVQYIPRADVDMSLLERTDHASYCPYKGDCSYYSITAPEGPSENSVWTYETPYPATAAIREYLAFYPNKVEIRETA